MRFHVVSLPHTETTKEFSACAFTEKVRKFCVMMKSLGHHVTLYAGEGNEAPCDELVTCITRDEQAQFTGGQHYTKASFVATDPQWMVFNSRAVAAMVTRLGPKDFICVIGGHAHKPIADAFPANQVVEFGIGYGGTFAPYRVWESYAWMHTCYGAASMGQPQQARGEWFDAVIPGYFEPELFPFRADKDDYFLFVGRMTELKGPHIASMVARHLGARLILAGPGDFDVEYGERVGEIGPEQRGQLMAGARALIMPTMYVEPFGNVAVEAQACGTPVLTTDWGAMTETVEHGVTGYRCRTLGEFVRGAQSLDALAPAKDIRERMITNYSVQTIALKYEAYFERLGLLWGDGWNSL